MESGDKSQVFLNTIIITASTIIEKAIFFIVNIVIARYLDINHYGEYTTALAFASFFSLFTDMGINEGLIREINYEEEKEQTLFNVVLLKAVLSVLVFIIFAGATLSTNYSHRVIYLIFLFGLVRFGDEYLRLYYTYYDGCDRFIVSAIYRFFFALSFFGAVLAVILTNGGNAEIALFRLFVVIFFLILMTYKISRGRWLKIDIPYTKSYIKKTIPFASTFIYYNIISQGCLVILPLLHGTVYSGIFQNAYIFLITLLIIPQSFGRVFITYLYRQKGDDEVERFQFAFDIITRSFVLLSFYIAAILFLFADFVIIKVFGVKYQQSIATLKIISLGIPFIFNAASIMLTAMDKQKLNSVILRSMALLSVSLNVVVGYFYRDEGTAAATVLTYLLIFVLSYIMVKLNTGLNISGSVCNYLKGVAVFIICRVAYGYFPAWNPVFSMAVITLIFLLASILLLFRRDDLRIAKEILGR